MRTGSNWWFSKILRIRIGSDSILSDQDWTQTEKFHSPLMSAMHMSLRSLLLTLVTFSFMHSHFKNRPNSYSNHHTDKPHHLPQESRLFQPEAKSICTSPLQGLQPIQLCLQGCQLQVNKKCQTTCKKMPNRYKKRQSSWNRPNAVGFDISRWINWQKHSGTREQGTNYCIQATNNYCTLEKTNRIKLETLLWIFHPFVETRGGQSHFFWLRLRSCSKIFESGSGSGSGNFSILSIRLLFRLRQQSPMQP